jgi:hypothetical protein
MRWWRMGWPIGYIYYVLEENKGLMGDLYVMREHRTVERENLLLWPQPSIPSSPTRRSRASNRSS